MKIIFSLLLLASVIAACAPKPIKYTREVYPEPFEFILIDTIDMSKDEIYVKAHEWIAKSFGSAKSVIDMQDKEAGKLIGKAITIEPVLGGEVSYIISIDVKDGKYRASMTDFYHKQGVLDHGAAGVPIYKSYGDLNSDHYEYKSVNTNRIVIDEKYYGIKNYSMSYAKTMLDALKTAMHTKEKEF